LRELINYVDILIKFRFKDERMSPRQRRRTKENDMADDTARATSQASVSESNRSRIVKHLYHNGISSRAQIAKALELTPAAITKITARLIEAGMIEETGDLEGSKNRRSIVTDTGWRVTLGRGLDIYQRYSDNDWLNPLKIGRASCRERV